MMENIFETVKAAVDSEKEFLNNISQEIWNNPELKFEEVFAHDLLTSALKDKGFSVEKNYILPTAFKAEFKSNRPGPTVAVICEYDALPKIGHACGHNLIAESGLGAGIAIKKAMEKHPEIPGKVVVLGTPAEEGGAGKCRLIEGGAFQDIDAALMVHPCPDDHVYPPFIAINRVKITYEGLEAHAAGYPWEGINALDAAVACYNNISQLRQQVKPTWKFHAVIIKGGEAANVIPGHTEIQLNFRAPTTGEMKILEGKIAKCAEAAALSTGCKLDFVVDPSEGYEGLTTNRVLGEMYKKYAESLGVKFEDGNPRIIPFTASSDMGNVSHVVPSIHCTYSVGTKAPNHSVEFANACAKPDAQGPTLTTMKSMAMVALNVMCCSDVFDRMKKQFDSDLIEDAGL